MYWLSALSMPEALGRGCRCLASGLRSLEGRCRVFNPSDRVAWVAVDPKSLEPPFRETVSGRSHWWLNTFILIKPVGEVSWLLVSLIVLLDTRVSNDQNTSMQLRAFERAGVLEVHEEQMSD